MSWNYHTIKQYAKQNGLQPHDLLAMSRSRDPFYVGSPADIAMAQWFAEVWRDAGMHKVHLRRVHYWLISNDRDPRRLPRTITWDGGRGSTDVYINNKNCWAFLQNASLRARDLGYVNPDHIVDARSPDPRMFASTDASDASYEVRDDWYNDVPELPQLEEKLDLLPSWSTTVTTAQPYLVEIWIEKTTVEDMLLPLCARYGVNYIPGQGYASATRIREFLLRVRAADKPARILYISDYDRSGRGMPAAVARRIEYYQRMDGYGELDITLEAICLTDAQIYEFNLPRSPEDGESVELDAMMVNYPHELRDIVESAISRYRDDRLARKDHDKREELEERLQELHDTVAQSHEAELEELDEEYATIAREINAVVEKHADRYDDIRKRAVELRDLLRTELEERLAADIDTDAYRPEPETAGDTGAELYASGREYLEQLDFYKRRGINGGQS